MRLDRLKTLNFKNTRSNEFQFNSKIVAFVGNNGKGKTNTLDAIHYLGFCKSFLNSQDILNIKHNENFFYIEGDFQTEEKELIQLSFHKEEGKKLKNNHKKYSKLSLHIGKFPLVVVSPYDRNLILEGSETRRKFLDSILCQIDPKYLEHLIKYQKALSKRNLLLKHFSSNNYFDQTQLDPYDEVLVKSGMEIFIRRNQFIVLFQKYFQQLYSLLSSSEEIVSIDYKSQLFENEIDELFKIYLKTDRMYGYTTQGIHKDDLIFSIFNHPIKSSGSQGQQKTFLIALKLAQLQIIKDKLERMPLLLLDDIFDKLDASRVENLVQLVNNIHFGQMFITDTDKIRTKTILDKLKTSSEIFEL